ncbi:hypothetical protein TrispH2_007440, partial [Trichoplax sp. H2]
MSLPCYQFKKILSSAKYAFHGAVILVIEIKPPLSKIMTVISSINFIHYQFAISVIIRQDTVIFQFILSFIILNGDCQEQCINLLGSFRRQCSSLL